MQVSDEMVKVAVDEMERHMFAPHELPLDDELHANYLRTARAALTAALSLQGWRTIDSAPKDGTDVLLWFPLEGLSSNFPKHVIGHWRESPSGGYWVHQGRAVFGYSVEYQPTHWKPLDAPPATAGKATPPQGSEG